MSDGQQKSFYQRVYDMIDQIPRGQVATYGDIAAWAGRPGAARQAGYAMHRCPASLPWHRVINAQGRLSLPADSSAGITQRRRLQEEGVALVGGRIALARHRWAGPGA